MLEALTDLGLVNATVAGNPAAYGELVNRYQEKLHHILVGLVQNQEDARDLAQEVFIKAYRGLRSFCADATFYTWLYRIAVNTCIDFRRSSRCRVASISLEEPLLAESDFEPLDTRWDSDPERVLAVEDLQRHVHQAIEDLAEPFRSAVWLRDIEGCSLQEMAALMHCPLGTVKTRIHRGRLELRRVLAPFLTAE
jgi:RNA polymerase sigma-70 factor (ECF subfamily)